jgi:hypothetical protein
MATFSKFTEEIRNHGINGYHRQQGPIDKELVFSWFQNKNWHPTKEYLQFLTTIGPGRYFDDHLIIFSLDDSLNSIAKRTSSLIEVGCNNLIAIGYDGTTTGCYCVSKDHADDAKVYWFEWEESIIRKEHVDFVSWIDNLPNKLFDENIFAGFKPIKDIQAIKIVIEKRNAFNVNISIFDKKLVRPPGHEKDFLSRYNRVVFVIEKKWPVDIDLLTVKIHRTGSEIGDKNVAYATIPIKVLKVGIENVELFIFDPFYLPFRDIRCEYNPDIDLNLPSRINYKEIMAYL